MSESQFLMPIHRAIKRGDLNEVTQLIGDDSSLLCMWTPFGTWLHDAASHGMVEIVRWLLSRGVDIDAYNDSNECPPICDAAANGHVEVLRVLIEAGASLDASDSVRNPLLAAIVSDAGPPTAATAKLLIDAEIDTSIRYANLDNMDALEFAKKWGRSDIVVLLE